jgi:SSS family solute:Na+ symporter/sodium/proline symporter
VLFAVGGIDEVIAYATSTGKTGLFGNWASERSSGISGPIIAISFFVPTMLLLLGDANMYQRIFSSKDSRNAQKAVLFWVIGVVILEAGINVFGLVGATAASQGIIPELHAGGVADVATNLSENVIPEIARNAVPLFLGMILVATMMAIVISTADSFLLIPATNLTRDVYQRFIKPDASDKQVVLTSRIVILLLGGVAFMLVEQFPTILSAAYTAYLVYGAAITPALLAAFLWKRATFQGAVASILTGTIVTLIWTFYLSNQDFYSSWSPFLQEVTYPAVTLSVAALIGVSLATPAPDEAKWKPFFVDE